MPRILVKRVGKGAGWSLEPKRYEKALRKAINKVAKPELIKMFDEVISGARYSRDGSAWKHKVKFRSRFSVRGNDAILYVFPSGKNRNIWNYVSKGTRPHKIRAKPGKVLSFMWGGPGSIPSKTTTALGSGGSFGGPSGAVKRVAFQEVNHPGSVGRNFEGRIAKEYGPKFRRLVNRTIDNLVQEKNQPFVGSFGVRR